MWIQGEDKDARDSGRGLRVVHEKRGYNNVWTGYRKR